MKICRVLNTNAVLSCNESNEEIILLGAGVGFKSKPGDEVDLSKAEKCFVMKDKEHQSRFQELVTHIPQEYIMVAEQIISLGKNFYDMKLGESIHISLADHIHTSVINKQNGIEIPNSLLLDIKRFYNNEYKVGVQGLSIIKEQLKCQLSHDESGFIAMHFVNAQYGNENTNIKKIIQLVQDLNDMILRELKVIPDEDSLNYYRYMTHLKFFAQRVIQNIHYLEKDGSFFDTLLLKYPKEYICSKKICNYCYEKYNYRPSHDEVVYLTVHLTHLSG